MHEVYLVQYEDGWWQRVPFTKEMGFSLPLISIHSGEIKQYNIDWGWHGELAAGRYMFIRDFDRDFTFDLEFVMIEFTIDENTP
ncbi:MAG: hypothetical protein FWC96_04130 [Oscillospiraceae bacterium]|nr:hypothetical protein [Oscillospiraceae bacterium]